MKILVVEDDKRLADSIAELMKLNRYQADAVYNGRDGLEAAGRGEYDLIILDIMLPYVNGYEIAKNLRDSGSDTPILMLTAKSELEDRVYGLEHGADYYLAKPFHTRELIACVKALLRRQGALDNKISFGNTTLDLDTSMLSTGQGSVRLSSREFELMRIFMVTQHRNVSKETLLVKVWGYDTNAAENLVEVYVSLIRKKLTAIGSNILITAISRQGYHLETEDAVK